MRLKCDHPGASLILTQDESSGSIHKQESYAPTFISQ